MRALRNSPPDCFSQMLTHLEPRISCTACNSLGSKPSPYGYVEFGIQTQKERIPKYPFF